MSRKKIKKMHIKRYKYCHYPRWNQPWFARALNDLFKHLNTFLKWLKGPALEWFEKLEMAAKALKEAEQKEQH